MTEGTLLGDRPIAVGAKLDPGFYGERRETSRSTRGPSQVEPIVLRRVTSIGVVVWCMVTAWLGWHRIISPDEYESVHQGWLIAEGAVPFRDFATNHPPVYFYLLSLFSHGTDDGVQLLRLGRGLSYVAGLLTLGLIGRITRQIYGRDAACWAILAWSLQATLWEWSIEARTDAWLVPCWLLAVTLVLDRWPRWRVCQMMVIGCFLGTAFWINQKAVLHSLPVGLYILFESRGDRRRWFDIGWALLGSLIPTAIVVSHLAAHGALAALHLNIFSGGSDLVKEDPYGYFRALTARELVKHDPGYVLIGVLSTVGLISRWRTATNPQRFAFLTTAWMMATFLTTPGPFGYYLMSILPLATTTIGGWLARKLSRLGNADQRADDDSAAVRPRRLAPALIGCAIVYLLAPTWRLTQLVAADNGPQCRVIQVGQTLVDRHDRVFDLSGALAGRNDAYPFHTRLTRDGLTRFREQLPPLLPTLRAQYVPLLVNTDRVWFYWNEDERAVLRHQFPSLWGPLCVPGYDSLEPLTAGTHTFDIWYDADYETTTDGILIDGRTVRGVFRLAAGSHTVTVIGEPQRVRLVDAAYRRRPPLPPHPVQVEDFLYQIWVVRYFFDFE